MNAHIDTIVVGGGQAGLSVSWHLKRVGREHVVLDRGSTGDTWRRRWDSFCLVTPNWFCQLPGFPYDGDEPEGFMLRDQIVDYVERYARSFDPPYREGVEVRRIGPSNDAGRFALDTSDGVLTADNLIIAVGTHQHPNIPAWGGKLTDDILRLHTRDYRNPAQLPDGAVLVVGSGQSGCQVVEDLSGAGREVHLSVGGAGRIPRRYRGRDILEWEAMTGYFETPVDEHPDGSAIRFKAHPHLSGRGGGRTIDLRQLALNGVKLHGRVVDAAGDQVHLADDLADSLDAIDKACWEGLSKIDEYIDANDIDAPESELQPADWRPAPEPATLDLGEAGIGSVIYATGFHPDFRWIDLPVFDERGYPRYERGVTDLPGLYFVGLHWMHTAGSGLFYQVGRDAEYVVDRL
ncbi:MAG: MSMEG_0569 family flavin-dependent oxidoreductase [Alphaproteobacteria bacterium]|nr:MSMEG_0569 family flavin-dependent oxidoreductase [Alphaproteobacteria bacterium]